MSTQLQTVTQADINIWEDKTYLAEIRNTIAPMLSEMEFQMLVGVGRATQLNPFLREIWAIKYGSSAAQIFIGRDGYRKAAQRHPQYDYHQVDAVYSNDEFFVKNGEVNHSYTLKDRGSLLGAYCIVKRKNAEKPTYVFVELKEYHLGQSVWKTKPATMIKKVAEMNALRAAFQDILGGTYGEEEIQQKDERRIEGKTQTERLSALVSDDDNDTDSNEALDAEYTEYVEATGHYITEDEAVELAALISKKGLSAERKQRAFEYFKVNTLAELTRKQYNDFVEMLNKL